MLLPTHCFVLTVSCRFLFVLFCFLFFSDFMNAIPTAFAKANITISLSLFFPLNEDVGPSLQQLESTDTRIFWLYSFDKQGVLNVLRCNTKTIQKKPIVPYFRPLIPKDVLFLIFVQLLIKPD